MPSTRLRSDHPDDLRLCPRSQRIVASALLRLGPATRSELIIATKLSRPTVYQAIERLGEAGLVEPVTDPTFGMVPRLGGVPRVPPGRRGQGYQLTRRAGVAVGVEVGRQHITVAAVDGAHHPVVEPHSSPIAAADRTPQAMLDQTAALVSQTVRSAAGSDNAVLGVGVGLPIPMDGSGMLAAPSLLPEWKGIDNISELSRRLPGLAVRLGNEASLGALGEHRFGVGAAMGVSDLTYLKLGTGIGAGIVTDGRLRWGAAGTAGEIGHITIDRNGRMCRCGNRGCLEKYAGGPALLDSAREVTSNLPDLAALVERARSGNQPCRRILAEAGAAVGVAVGTLVNLNSPELVVLGGTLSEAGDLLRAPLRRALDEAAMDGAADMVKVEFAQLGRWSSSWGAIALVIDRYSASIA